jgi:flagellar motor switch protein FliM
MIYERFSRHLRSSLYNLLRCKTNITLSRVEALKFSDYLRTLPTSAALHLVQVHPLSGTALFLLEPRLVYLLVDGFFGGGGRPAASDGIRELTSAEMRVTHIVLEQAYQDFARAWDPVLAVRLEPLKAETNPQFVNIASPSEKVVVVRQDLDFQGNRGQFHIAMPYAMLEPIKEALDGGIQSDREELDRHWVQSLSRVLEDAKLEIHGTLAETELTLREILRLKAGDVITVDLPEQVPLLVEGYPLFRGTFGAHRGNNSVKITETTALKQVLDAR